MMYQDNDTISVEQQKANQPQVEEVKTKTNHAMIAKLLASAGVGMVAGSGVAYAASTHDPKTDEEHTDVTEGDAAATPNDQQGEVSHRPTTEERLSALEEKARIREQQMHAQREAGLNQREAELQQREAELNQQKAELQQREEALEQKEQELSQGGKVTPEEDNKVDFFKDHEVKIMETENIVLDDGQQVTMYMGTVDGHVAAFVDDGHGHIVRAVIDEDGNGDPTDNDVIDLRQYNITQQQLAEYQVSAPEEPAPEIKVLSVEHDVNLEGENVDVAVVSVNGNKIMLVDVDQDHVVDAAVADLNNNGVIDDGEVEDFRQHNLSMPTEDDIDNNALASNDSVDYSNDVDTNVYDV